MTVTIVGYKGDCSMDEIDNNIKHLVNVLNGLSGIETIGSCGGHDNPHIGQHESGTWFISFWVSTIGVGCLLKLKELAETTEDVTIYNDGTGWWSIDGINCVDPDMIAEQMDNSCGQWFAGKVTCTHCSTSHISAHPLDCTKIECPNCGQMTFANPDDAIWERDHIRQDTIH